MINLTGKENNWEIENEDIFTVNWKGDGIKLENVPTKKNKRTGETLVNINDIIKAEQEHNTKEINIKPFDMHPLLLLYAKLRYYPRGIIEKGYRLRKMIFYLEKKLEEHGYENSFIFDKIVAARAGPVPKNLRKTMKELKERGLVEYTWDNKPGVSAKFKLTKKGEITTKDLWEKTPDDVKMIVLKIKEEIYLITSSALKHKVHEEYPEYRKFYTELDNDA